MGCRYTHFDHADIYGKGDCERHFGDWLHNQPTIRQNCLLTTKCGIRFADTPAVGDPFRYDFGADLSSRRSKAARSARRRDCRLTPAASPGLSVPPG